MIEKSQVVLVVGGYGEVGRHVVRTLISMQRIVVIAGRNASKGQTFIASLGNYPEVSFRTLDLTKSLEELSPVLEGVAAVIMCSDQSDIKFVNLCLEKGIQYVDIAAEDEHLREIEKLNTIAQVNHTTAVLSVGLAPGLTNLLVRECREKSPELTQLEIGILLGTGDAHGAQAIDWTMKNLLHWNSSLAPKNIDYGSPWGLRQSYPFEFSDQYALERTMGIKASTFLCFSSKVLTAMTFFLRQPLLLPLIQKFPKILKVIGNVSWGGDDCYAIQIRGLSENKEVQVILKGQNEALVTGVMAAVVTDYMMRNIISDGVFHIHQIIKISDIWSGVHQYAGCERGWFT